MFSMQVSYILENITLEGVRKLIIDKENFIKEN